MMAEPICFEYMFSNLITKLKESDKVLEVSSHFGPHHSLEDMFSYLWGLVETRSCLIPSIQDTLKSEERSEKLRAEGNKFYQKKMFEEAIKHYNLSIMFAPHPQFVPAKEMSSTLDPKRPIFCNGSGANEYKALALAFANRSAVLLELKQYTQCVHDVDQALMYGYPKLLQSKLAERKARCLISLGMMKEASQVIKEATHLLEDLQLEEAKSKMSRDSLNKMLQECQSHGQHDSNEKTLLEGQSQKYAVATKEELLLSYQNPEPPVLHNFNTGIPSLSDAVKLEFSKLQGRYLKAERDIYPGELLVVEEAYSKVLLLDSSLETHCSLCLKQSLSPLPCPLCPKVIFCSEFCRYKGLTSSHGQECNVLSTLAALDMGKNAVLAYRIMNQMTFSQLKTLIPIFKLEITKYPPEMLGFNCEAVPIYSSSDYRTIYHLVTNKEHRSVSDIFKRCAMAVVLTWLLKESQQYFSSTSSESCDPSQEDIMLAGCTLFVHMMNLPCNAHSITELQVDVKNFQNSISQEIGCGAFSVLSLTNHSCNPSAARFSYGKVVTLRAIRFIKKGSELTDSYGEHYAFDLSAQRKSVLSKQYYFSCLCEPCENNWPTYSNLSVKFKLKCLKCSKYVDRKGWCTICKVSLMDTLVKKDVQQSRTQDDLGKYVKNIVSKYENAHAQIIKGDDSLSHIDELCSFISFIDKYVQQPCKTYFEAQETLKHYYERQGSRFYRSAM